MDSTNFYISTVAREDLTLVPGKTAVVKWRKTKGKKWIGKVTRSNKVAEKSIENVSCHSETNKLQCGFSQTISSSHQFNDVYCVTCSVGDADRLCVFCSRPCHPFKPCGSFLEPGCGGGVICQNCDKEWLQPENLPSTPKTLRDISAQTTPNIDLIIEKMKDDKEERKRRLLQEKHETMRENAENQDPDYIPPQKKMKYLKKVAPIKNDSDCRELTSTKKSTSKKKNLSPCDLSKAQMKARKDFKKRILLKEIQVDDNVENEEIAYRSDQSSGTDSDDSETLSSLRNSREKWVQRHRVEVRTTDRKTQN